MIECGFATSPDAVTASPLTSPLAWNLALSPVGAVYLEAGPGEHDSPAPAAAERIRQAFERGGGHGLLQLGAAELGTSLPASLTFGRELGHLFMARLTAVPNLAQDWHSVELPAPGTELEWLAAAAPPFAGAEYLGAVRLAALWQEMLDAARAEIAAAASLADATQGAQVSAWLKRKHPSWNLVGRVCLHLAENKADEHSPFAFLATYASHVSREARVQHLPLGRALQAHAGAAQHAALLNLLLPVQKAAEQIAWLRGLVDSGKVFHPLAWTPLQAHEFLRSIPQLEASGLIVRVPDWWKPRQPPRPQVRVNLGQSAAGLGLQTMLAFQVELSLDGEVLSPREWQELRAAGDGLVRVKGRWVEIDREKLDAVLAHWQQVQRDSAAGGMSFLEGMRLLAGAHIGREESPELEQASAEWARIVPGEWLRETLAQLHGGTEGGEGPEGPDPRPELLAQLRPYQQHGVRWLWWLNRLGLGGCLADDMGLGKTVQVLGLITLAKREADAGPHLLVVPASLIANWQAEAARFAPHLRLLIAHPSALPAKDLAALSAQDLSRVDVVVTSYGSVGRMPWLAAQPWSMIVLDEAQAIKNPGTQQTRQVKALKSRVRFALTGTPVENRLDDLWSLFDFICPGLLGSARTFNQFTRRLAQDEGAGYAPLRKLVGPYILRRLKSDKRVIADLPDKTEVKAWCALTRVQASLYQQAVDALAETIGSLDGMARRGAVLAFLMRFKQICNHPSQWLGDGAWQPQHSGKFARLQELTEAIAARQEKLLVFTQFQEMTAPLAGFLQGVFGRPGLVLHGGTAVKARRALVDDFQRDRGPPFFVLSLKAGGTGLNLTAASHVVHFDRWWNPAVENQATDRAYRIGQKKNVLVHKFVCRGTVEERIDALIESKTNLSQQVVEGGGEVNLTELSQDDLLRLVALDIGSAMDESRAG
jgi:SNF2-related domain/SNF2 Helicase protein/Helicase conserved C-terminal domain